jgi:polar amino acid transport system substrate-binding protein
MRTRLKARAFAAVVLTGIIAAGSAARARADDLLQQIKAKGEIVIASEARYAPFEFVEGGKIVGYDVDLFNDVMKALPGVKVRQLDLPFQGLLPGLQTGKFDAIITAVTVTQKRYDTYRLSLPVADATFAVVKRKGDKSITKPEDVAGKSVGTQAGSAQLQGTQAFSDELKAKGLKPIANIQTYVDFNEAYADLAAGRTDAVINSLPNLLYLQKQRPDVFEVVLPTFGPKTYFSWAYRKDDASRSLADFFDAQLRKLEADGTMAQLQKKWFGFVMEVPSDALPRPAS